MRIIGTILAVAAIILLLIWGVPKLIQRGKDSQNNVAAASQTPTPTLVPIPPTPTRYPTQVPLTPYPTQAPPTPYPTQVPPTPYPTIAPAIPTATTIAARPPTAVPATPTTAPAAPAPASGINACSFPTVGDFEAMPKTKIELIGLNTWFHRVFNERLFNAANNWGGADSWFLTWALGPNSGGAWTSHGNSGEVVYRGTSTHIQWCLGLTTSSQYKNQFMAGAGGNAAVNVRIAPNSVVTVQTAGGKTIQQATSDAGDITIILPDTGTVVILVDYTTAAPTHESLVWVGPYDRSDHINTVDGR
jgi:hypothetical protein